VPDGSPFILGTYTFVFLLSVLFSSFSGRFFPLFRAIFPPPPARHRCWRQKKSVVLTFAGLPGAFRIFQSKLAVPLLSPYFFIIFRFPPRSEDSLPPGVSTDVVPLDARLVSPVLFCRSRASTFFFFRNPPLFRSIWNRFFVIDGSVQQRTVGSADPRLPSSPGDSSPARKDSTLPPPLSRS